MAYRETILGSSEVTYIHKKQSGGSGQFAKEILSVEPLNQVKEEKLTTKLKAGQYQKNYSWSRKRSFEVQWHTCWFLISDTKNDNRWLTS